MKVNRLVKPQKTKRRNVKPLKTHPQKPSESMQFIRPLNVSGKFTYIDQRRNQGAVVMMKTQVNQLVMNYGMDLQYFRKYNTFFKKGEQNHANLIYGQDTTAEFYASGMIRAFVNIQNMGWTFNQIGLQNTEQINIFLIIQNFQQAFMDDVSKVETRHISVPVSGNTMTNEITGRIVEPEFDATIYHRLQDSDNLKVKNVVPVMRDKRVNNLFYKSNFYQTKEYPITGSLSGKLKRDRMFPDYVSGVLQGDLTFHCFENLQDSKTWKIAPQVGDYFKFDSMHGINEEWQITQVYDRNLTNKSGINPLLGKYIFQCTAVKRQSSFQENSPDLQKRDIGTDIQEILGDISGKGKGQRPVDADQYELTKNGKNKFNRKTNRLGKNVYDYAAKQDQTYGGIQNTPDSK